MKKGSIVLIILILAGLYLLVGITTLKTPEIKGVVLDAETGKPIEGANVVAGWGRTYSGPGGQFDGKTFKELKLKTGKDGTFKIPAYVVINWIPFPFGQGGTFGMAVYAHGCKHKSFIFNETENFKRPKYEEFEKMLIEKKLLLSLPEIKDPKSYIKNRGDIYFYTEADEVYRKEEDKLFLEKFGMRKWDKNIQYELAEAYYRMGDYKSAIKKLEEIIKDDPNAKTKYFDEKYQKYKSKLKESSK